MPEAESMITEAQLLADIALVSEIILEHGEKYAPLLDRLEQELEARRRDSPIDRARKHIAKLSNQTEKPLFRQDV
ncbi:hypothetical protein NK6_8615 [Bradyrhizobium diazoefficiens]|uniref:Uncharacterized protein n=2 Tax=Bradyrhizobium diazoefficiens TaxID=1355477 RepID=A0A0E4BV60_9BRAD|nr:hypothetical protein NK6_8615 [Bradyrhizobium diazoefficiens]BCA04046.1 hypothetical protein H12S4_49500 [Bradyrhizobium diazoefficiens]BCE39573.1 hypothetical protein XF3B_46040 [Bradyrhizobium diazoefficiens]BCF52970.1 hypothetical protein XF17B_46080 [Bradyrhizobium diazoefficiens]